MKETAKVKKESKETCHRERLEKTNGLLITAPHFQNKMEGDFLQLKKNCLTNDKFVTVKVIKTEDSLERKYNKKAAFFYKNMPQLKKNNTARKKSISRKLFLCHF